MPPRDASGCTDLLEEMSACPPTVNARTTVRSHVGEEFRKFAHGVRPASDGDIRLLWTILRIDVMRHQRFRSKCFGGN